MNKFMKFFAMLFIMMNVFLIESGVSQANEDSRGPTVKSFTDVKEYYKKENESDYTLVKGKQVYGDEEGSYTKDVDRRSEYSGLDTLDIKFYFTARIFNRTQSSSIDCYIKTTDNDKITCRGEINWNIIYEIEAYPYYSVTIYADNITKNFSGELYVGSDELKVYDVEVSCIRSKIVESFTDVNEYYKEESEESSTEDIVCEYIEGFKPYLNNGLVVLKAKVTYSNGYNEDNVSIQNLEGVEIKSNDIQKIEGDTSAATYILNTKTTPDKEDQGLKFVYTLSHTSADEETNDNNLTKVEDVQNVKEYYKKENESDYTLVKGKQVYGNQHGSYTQDVDRRSEYSDLDTLDIRFNFNAKIVDDTQSTSIYCYIKTTDNDKITCRGEINWDESIGSELDDEGNIIDTYNPVTIYADNITKNFSGELYIGSDELKVYDVEVSCIKESESVYTLVKGKESGSVSQNIDKRSEYSGLDTLDIKFDFNAKIVDDTQSSSINCYIKTTDNDRITCRGEINWNESTGSESDPYYKVTIYADNITKNFSGELYVGSNELKVYDIEVSCIKESEDTSEDEETIKTMKAKYTGSISQILKDGYKYTISGKTGEYQKFDVSKGDVKIDSSNIIHFGKDAGDQESTVRGSGIAIITGTTTKYIVECNKNGKGIILEELNITSTNKSPISLGDDAVIKAKGTNNKVTSKGNYNAIDIANGTMEVSGVEGGEISIICSDNGAGVGASTSSGHINITNSANLTIKTSNGAGIGSGKSGICGDISISKSKIKIEEASTGIGSGESGTCSKISITSSVITIEKASGAGIGASNSGKCNEITVSGSDIEIKSCSVGIGSDSSSSSSSTSDSSSSSTGSTCGSISIKSKSQIKIDSSKIGIGASAGSSSGKITLDSETQSKISASSVGVGAEGENGTISDGIELSGAKVQVSNASVGIGAASSGKVGSISSSSSTIIITTAASEGVGIGASGTVENINLSSSNVEISGGSIGIGSSNAMGNITLTSCSKIIVSASTVGIGWTSDNSEKGITISGSSIKIKGGPTVGIGTTSKMNNIEIKSSSNVLVSGSLSEVGIGTKSKIGNISISSSSVEAGSSTVGIGASSNATMGNITISNCTKVIAYGDTICIGSASDNTSSKISISSSGIKVAGGGVGIGSGGKISSISISSCDNVYINTKTIGIGNSTGNIEVTKSVLDINTTSTDNGTGLGGDNFDNSSKISISNSVVCVVNKGSGAGIGTQKGTLSEITISDSVIKIIGDGNGAGIGSGVEGKVNNINLNRNSIGILKESSTSGAGIGSGKSGTVSNIILNKNKIAVSSGNGAGIGSGESGSVTGTIKMTDGVIVAKGGSGAGIGSGKSSSVKDIAIDDGRVYVVSSGNGAGIGSGQSGSVSGSILIKDGEFVCDVSSGSGIGKGNSGSVSKIQITTGGFIIKSASGCGMSADNIIIDDGNIEIYAMGSNPGINGWTTTILNGVIKSRSGSGNDINGNSVTISDNANVQAYNGNSKVYGINPTQKKLTTDLLRGIEGEVWLDGSSSNKIKTDKYGNVYYWGNANREFHINGMKFVV